MITERDIEILRTVAHYYIVGRSHVQQLCFTDDNTGRPTRRRLQKLVCEHYLNRSRAPVFNSQGGSPWPIYYPSPRGIELLAEHFGDERYLLTPTRAPEPLYLMHWLAITETHIALDLAIAQQSYAKVEDWLSEWDIANKHETQPEKRYRIYTLLRDHPRLLCAPDAAFLLSVREHRKAYYLEQDRHTSGVRQIAVSKTPGYAEMAKRQFHFKHFPSATIGTFTVLMIAPSERRRDALRSAIRGKPGCEFWRFASATDITAERVLHAPIFFPCDGEPAPLVKPQTDQQSSASTASIVSPDETEPRTEQRAIVQA